MTSVAPRPAAAEEPPPGGRHGIARTLLAPPAGARGHFYAIDFARGVAALVVLLWHYQHFFFAGVAEAPSVPAARQPLYALFEPFYRDGFFAVQFFWMISGFVFTAVYAGRRATTRDFAVNRFARLYPLHLVTLLVVAALQIASVRLVGHEQIYGNNDGYHFLLNLLFASHWGLERGYSFNGPVWSVSIEMLVYAIFWVTLPVLFRRGLVGPAALAAAAWAIHYHTGFLHHEDLFRCLFYFYAGAVAYAVVAALGARPWTLLAGSAAATALGVAIFRARPHSVDSIGMPLFLAGLLLVFCAIEATSHGRRFRAIRWVGDNTYGTYLWHVPIQIAALILFDRAILDRGWALSPWFLGGYVLVVVAVARASFLFIEAPARDRLRRLATGRPPISPNR